MFLFNRPSMQEVERFLAESRELPLSYGSEGLIEETRAGFVVDELVTIVGRGEAAYRRAAAALTEWRHFELGWVELFPKRASTSPGTVVAVLIKHLGFWSLNGCRVVESAGRREGLEYGFVYGTLANHAECGEELFQVSYRPETGDVLYRIRAVSKPRAALARLGSPIVRSLQARFRHDSSRALRQAIAD
ncbi:MAG TPA: DUF1990 domain-containing protein [Blastocatellia bacterium]|nr:DUF1990 domain-containing protein [Blastocatellia bacterium]